MIPNWLCATGLFETGVVMGSLSLGCESDLWGVSLEFLLFIPTCFLLIILYNSLVS